MKTITKFENAIKVNAVVTRKTALLTYLEYHFENPCLHPDDVLAADSGYSALGGIIVYFAHLQKMPAIIEYPTALLKLVYTIGQIASQELTLTERQHLEVITDFLDDFAESAIDDVLYSVEQLLPYDEDNVLEEILDVLIYVKGAK